MAHIDQVIAQEAEGPDSGLYAIVQGMLAGEQDATTWQAIGIARAVRWVVSNADDIDVQNFVGSMYLKDLEVLVERTGLRYRAQRGEL
jgi:hypothetical protein